MDIGAWMERAIGALKAEFGDRLLVVGLQGSMRRGEAAPTSDIDILIVLETLSANDLLRCRRVLDTLPAGHRAHGFTCGRAELAAWPRSEIFAFAQDVRVYYGELEPLLPAVDRRDIEEGARLAVAGIYHLAAHTLLSEPDPAGHRAGLQKLLFFAMLQTTYLCCGTFAATRAELLGLLDQDESRLLTTTDDSFFADVMGWAARQLRAMA